MDGKHSFDYTVVDVKESWYFGEDTAIVRFPHLDLPSANALRRRLLTGLFTVAIESCYIVTNTSS
jgi:DNA-directed RNA polymerase subunit D